MFSDHLNTLREIYNDVIDRPSVRQFVECDDNKDVITNYERKLQTGVNILEIENLMATTLLGRSLAPSTMAILFQIDRLEGYLLTA
jgi:hypothetical protein